MSIVPSSMTLLPSAKQEELLIRAFHPRRMAHAIPGAELMLLDGNDHMCSQAMEEGLGNRYFAWIRDRLEQSGAFD